MNYSDILYKSNKLLDKINHDIYKLLEGKVEYNIIYRIKSEEHLLRKYSLRKYKRLEDVEDIIGFRILLKDEVLCNEVYNILYEKYKPYKVSNYFKKPKDTGFKAYLLKTDYYEINLEVQIMTYDMDSLAEKTHINHENRKYKLGEI